MADSNFKITITRISDGVEMDSQILSDHHVAMLEHRHADPVNGVMQDMIKSLRETVLWSENQILAEKQSVRESVIATRIAEPDYKTAAERAAE